MSNLQHSIEVWKDIPSYEGYYQISNLGKVKALPRITGNQFSNGGIRKQALMANGYLRIMLVKDGDKKGFPVHRLVAQAFIIMRDNRPYVNHTNGIKTDNRVENLQWCNQSENLIHAFQVLNRNVSTRSLTKEMVFRILSMKDTNKGIKLTAEDLSLPLYVVADVFRGKCYKKWVKEFYCFNSKESI